MKYKIIEIEQPKQFRPFIVSITIESLPELEQLHRGTGNMSANGSFGLYQALSDRLSES